MVFPFCPGITAADCDETVGRFLPGFWRRSGGEIGAGVGIPETLEVGAVGGIVVPDGQFEEDEAESEEDFGCVGINYMRLEKKVRLQLRSDRSPKIFHLHRSI